MAEVTPHVGVVVGSESDLATMRKCTERLEALGIPHEMRILSAHRTPQAVEEYAGSAAGRGVKVLIAGAGMSAALAGVLAARTPLPVIGVPLASGPLAGVDAVLSMLQMPPGVPVGCMAVGSAGAANAAVFAARILALQDPEVARRLDEFVREQAAKVARKDAELAGGG